MKKRRRPINEILDDMKKLHPHNEEVLKFMNEFDQPAAPAKQKSPSRLTTLFFYAAPIYVSCIITLIVYEMFLHQNLKVTTVALALSYILITTLFFISGVRK